MCINRYMARPSKERIRLRDWFIRNISEPHLASKAAELFQCSRQTANRELNALVGEGLILATGKTQARIYKLKTLASVGKSFAVTPDLKEDVVWRQELAAHFADVRSNVRDICQYGFTEMFNNAVSHSNATEVVIRFKRTVRDIELWVEDNGVGIFNKIQRKFALDDQHHAILELCKGKLTTDPAHHSGEGVFFTSRMFDKFQILSDRLAFISMPGPQEETKDWLLDVDTNEIEETKGTWVLMMIRPNSERVMQAVFDKYAAPNNNYGFTKTCIPVHLAKYGSEQLMSRSQAKRLVAHFDRFVEVMLDFSGVEMIGQAFADEIFRVYKNENPRVNISVNRANEQVSAMIHRAQNAELEKDPTLFFKGMGPASEVGSSTNESEDKNDGSGGLSEDQI